jgi:N,N-dimethylformamidase
MHKLTGFTDRWSVKPGESIRFMVSSAVDAPFNLRFARHLCADPNPAGPGYREVTMPTILDGEHAGQEQAALPGSYGHATGLAIDPARGLTLTATIWPTLPNERQGLLSLSGQDGHAAGGRVRRACGRAAGPRRAL